MNFKAIEAAGAIARILQTLTSGEQTQVLAFLSGMMQGNEPSPGPKVVLGPRMGQAVERIPRNTGTRRIRGKAGDRYHYPAVLGLVKEGITANQVVRARTGIGHTRARKLIKKAMREVGAKPAKSRPGRRPDAVAYRPEKQEKIDRLRAILATGPATYEEVTEMMGIGDLYFYELIRAAGPDVRKERGADRRVRYYLASTNRKESA